jgi:N-dimethylarginine dimethylaminohydrolase
MNAVDLALDLPEPVVGLALAQPVLAISSLQCEHHPITSDCRYQVAWSINPHMAVGAVDFMQATSEHAGLGAALEAAGAKLLRLPFIHGAYDSVFTKDQALLLSRPGRLQALLARFRHSERRRERIERARYYEGRGFDVVDRDRGPAWEGGDIVMLPSRRGLFLGHGFRSHYAAISWLERHAGIPVWPLELRDPRLYHLDMALTILPNGTALVCATALAPHSLRVLEQVRGIEQLIFVPDTSALGFALNLVALGDVVILGAHDHRIEALLRVLGYRSVFVPLRQFHLAGGSAACLVAAVHRAPPE